MTSLADVGPGDHLTVVNGLAGRVRAVARLSSFQVRFTLDTDRCIDLDPHGVAVTRLSAARYEARHLDPEHPREP